MDEVLKQIRGLAEDLRDAAGRTKEPEWRECLRGLHGELVRAVVERIRYEDGRNSFVLQEDWRPQSEEEVDIRIYDD